MRFKTVTEGVSCRNKGLMGAFPERNDNQKETEGRNKL